MSCQILCRVQFLSQTRTAFQAMKQPLHYSHHSHHTQHHHHHQQQQQHHQSQYLPPPGPPPTGSSVGGNAGNTGNSISGRIFSNQYIFMHQNCPRFTRLSHQNCSIVLNRYFLPFRLLREDDVVPLLPDGGRVHVPVVLPLGQPALLGVHGGGRRGNLRGRRRRRPGPGEKLRQ